MSDFDEVLERLLTDPGFKAALAADPDGALAGYRLAAEERELLHAQVVAGDGGDRRVEERLTKSGVLGLVGPVATALGIAAAGGGQRMPGGREILAPAGGSQVLGAAPAHEVLGAAPAQEVLGAAPAHEVLAQRSGLAGTEVLGDAGTGSEVIGTAPGAGGTSVIGVAPTGSSVLGHAPVEATGYHTRVDVDGDGRWDAHTDYESADGGVDIFVDANKDGRIDFIGHDHDRDGLVDDAEYDRDHDGVFETRMFDDDGDGWMDSRKPM